MRLLLVGSSTIDDRKPAPRQSQSTERAENPETETVGFVYEIHVAMDAKFMIDVLANNERGRQDESQIP